MRIKTSKETLESLPEVTKTLGFGSNAETLKLAISLALNKYQCCYDLPSDEILENGFEIDTHILFGEDLDYYYELIKFYFNQDQDNLITKIEKKHISILIEYGYRELYLLYKLSKGDLVKFTKKIVEMI